MTTLEASQLDLFGASVPGTESTGGKASVPFVSPCPAVPALETRACGTCGGKGTYNKFLQGPGGVIDRYPTLVTCPDCHGEKSRTVTTKPACPESAKSYGMEPGLLIAMTAFTREMKRQGYGAKVETGGDPDTKKAKQCCNALVRKVASDKPEPTTADWENALSKILLYKDPRVDISSTFRHIAVDPNPLADLRGRAISEGGAGK